MSKGEIVMGALAPH